MTNTISYQHLLNTNYNTIEYGYTGSRGDIGYTGSGYSLTVDTVQVANANFFVSGANSISSSGGFLKVTGYGFDFGCNVYYSNTIVPNVKLQANVSNVQVINVTVGSIPVGSYNLFLYNPSGATAVKLQAFMVTS